MLDISFQVFTCGPENIPLPGDTVFVDQCVDDFKIVKQNGFYTEHPPGEITNTREVFDGSIAGQEPLRLVEIDENTQEFFIRVSRINADNSANTDGLIDGAQTKDFGPFHLHDDFVTHPTEAGTANAGWYHFGWDTSILPGAGKYSVDILFDDGTASELKQAIDFARFEGANAQREKIDPNPISGIQSDIDTTFEIVFLEDEES